jgi:peptidoglycan/LPS O-acetylase OafA/YrhL
MFLFPKGAEVHSFWNIIGVLLLILGVILSSTVQRVLSHPILLWLGAQSFPIYLIHGPLLRSLLNWMLYAFTSPVLYEQKDEEGNVERTFARFPLPTAWKFFLVLPVYYAVLFLLAHLWTKKIESRCGMVTKWLEDTMCGVGEERVTGEIALQGDGRNHTQLIGTEETANGPLLPT